MGDNLSETEGYATDKEESIEKPTKAKRTYVMTEARKAAFERCRKAREEQVSRIQKEKKLKNIETKEEKLQKIKAELVIEDEVEAPPSPPPTRATPTRAKSETVTRPKKTRKPKTVPKEEEELDWHAPETYSSAQYHVFL